MRISDWSSDVCSSDLERLRTFDDEGGALDACVYHFVNPVDHDIGSRQLNGLELLAAPDIGKLVIPEDRFRLQLITAAPELVLTPSPQLVGVERLCFHEIGLENGSAHVCTPVTNATLVCRLLLE